MPITLGCPSCGKRFRARDESAGKRVKCPYCAAPVPVPTGDEPEGPPPELPSKSPLDDSGVGMVPTSRKPSPSSVSSSPAAPPVASPGDWGADEPPRPPNPFPPAPSGPQPAPAPVFPPASTSASSGFDTFPKPTFPRSPAPRPGEGGKTHDPHAIPGWKKARSGLFWVQLALLLFSLIGFAGFAKAVCVRAGIALPQGPGGDWVSIDGYVNTKDPSSVKLSKEELLDGVLYGVPIVFGGLFLAFGRLTSGAAPRSSGTKGLFAFSGLFTFLALAAYLTAIGCKKLLFKETEGYLTTGFLIAFAAAEFWFLAGLAAAGVALKRPKAAKAVGLLVFFGALVAAAATIGKTIYEKNYRPIPATPDTLMYESAVVMLAWLLIVGLYWQAVRNVRRAMTEFLEQTEMRV